MNQEFNTPVLFIIFNRPSTTKEVFDAIRRAKPQKLFIAADGPRKNKVGEKEMCEQTRSIVSKVDWDCDVKTLFREQNLGCGKAVGGAIDWFFENVDEGIILEDDCVPIQGFFSFCQLMLDKYREVPNISLIAGTNFLFGTQDNKNSYFFSNLPLIWGWATWKRTWQQHKRFRDFISLQNLTTPSDISSIIKSRIIRPRVARWMERMINGAFASEIDTWDAQLVYSIFKNKGLTITPLRNQIRNIGYAGTHSQAQSTKDPFLNMGVKELDLQRLVHPLLPPDTDWVMDNNTGKMIEKYALGGSIGLIKDHVPTALKNILKNIKRRQL